MPQNQLPIITVVTAAYNRGNVLKYAIHSVLRQTFTDWELIVVDDASTDDTAEIVCSFNDPRLRYFRLPENSGDQSIPNNEGIRLAKGRYVAFLNQDDLWFPDHLEKALAGIATADADWVYTLGLAPYAEDDVRLLAALPKGIYDPRYRGDIVGSIWLIKREVFAEIGGWRPHGEILLPPSQDLLIRAWHAGKRIRMLSCVTAIILPTSALSRKDCYIRRDCHEQEYYLRRVGEDPDALKSELLLKYGIACEEGICLRTLNILAATRTLVGTVVRRFLLLFGILPITLSYFIRYRRKGGFVDAVRKNRGLDRLV